MTDKPKKAAKAPAKAKARKLAPGSYFLLEASRRCETKAGSPVTLYEVSGADHVLAVAANGTRMHYYPGGACRLVRG